VIHFPHYIVQNLVCLKVEFLLKTDSGYPKDKGVNKPWQYLGIPFAITPIGQLFDLFKFQTQIQGLSSKIVSPAQFPQFRILLLLVVCRCCGVVLWGPSRHLGSFTAANWVSFD